MEQDEERAAGAVIIRDLDILERANSFRRLQIEPEVWKELARVFQDWTTAEAWVAECAPNDFYLAPRHWVPDDNIFTAWFELSYDGDEYVSELAKLSGLGDGQLALRFKTYGDVPGGGRRAYATFEKGAEFAGIIKSLASLGFVHGGRGVFFIPISISTDILLAAWTSKDYSAALSGIKPILARVRDSVQIFDQILFAVTTQ